MTASTRDLARHIDLEDGVTGTLALGDDRPFVGTDDRLYCLGWSSDRSRP